MDAIFNHITLLITHYNRSSSLEKLLKTLDDLGVKFAKIIVSDDGSKVEHLANLAFLKQQFDFDIILTPINKGLGNNINKGQDEVKTPFTLYIQEDFIPKPLFIDKLKIAYQYIKNDDDLDFVRFYAYFQYPYLKTIGNGFSEMVFNHLHFWQDYKKFYFYSDHPHLRRTNFLEKFGRYQEGIKSDRTEYNMMMQVLAVGAKAYFFNDFKGLLNQENSITEPSTVKRNFWRNNESIFISLTRHLYRYLRFNIELCIFKLKNIF